MDKFWLYPQTGLEHCEARCDRALLTLVKALFAFVIVVALTAGVPATARARSPFVWPLDPRPAVVTPFDPPDQDWLPGHRGVDVAGQAGQVVRATGDGVVIFAGLVAHKPVVSIDHGGGLRTTYEPVAAVVRRGARIRAGDPIGTLELGHRGCAGPCLHWGARRDKTYLDPLALVRATPIRLKPLAVH